MNTKPMKYTTKYSVTFCPKCTTRDSIIEDNLTDALRFVRDIWPDANLHGMPEGIDATVDGDMVAQVRLMRPNDEPLARTMEREAEKRESPMEREVRKDIEMQRITPKAEQGFNERYAKLDMLDKGTLIGELIRWTDAANRERKERDKYEQGYRAARKQIEEQLEKLTAERAKSKELADLLREANVLIADTKKVISEVMAELGSK